MALKDHIKSAASGAGVISVLAIAGGLLALGLGCFAGVAGATALGIPMLVGGLCTNAAYRLTYWAAGGVQQDDRLKHLAAWAGAGAAAYCLFSFCAPSPQAAANRNHFFGEAKTLVTKFERSARHVARDVNRHIVWPDLTPAHDRGPPQP